MKNKYIGWIVKEINHAGKYTFHAEYLQDGLTRNIGDKYYSPVPVIEFFDTLANATVKLEETPLGAYRVYVEET